MNPAQSILHTFIKIRSMMRDLRYETKDYFQSRISHPISSDS